LNSFSDGAALCFLGHQYQ